MKIKLANRINAVEESKTARFIPLFDLLQKQGKKIINFAVGEPHYSTPQEVIDAVKTALDRGQTRYGPVAGLFELRKTLAELYKGYGPDNIIILNGSKHCLYAIFQVIINPLDEVIIPLPCWVSFAQQVKLAGGKPVFVKTINHQLDIPAIESAITSRTRAILINSPNNPTGAVYPAKDLAKIAKIAQANDLYIVSDEAYEHYIYDGKPHISIFSFREIQDKTIITKSFSKHFQMTGFRIGYVAANSEIVGAIIKFQSHCTGNVCTFAQHGALAALGLAKKITAAYLSDLAAKREIAFQLANNLFECIKPAGAFYLFPDIREHLTSGETSRNFATRLLEKTGVAVVPGDDFGIKGHIRISYAVSEPTLLQGFEKIKEVL